MKSQEIEPGKQNVLQKTIYPILLVLYAIYFKLQLLSALTSYSQSRNATLPKRSYTKNVFRIPSNIYDGVSCEIVKGC